MDISVEEAIKVLRDAATSRRAQVALSVLEEDVSESARTEQADSKASGKPRFPTKETADEHFDGDNESAKGSNSSARSQELATARKGT